MNDDLIRILSSRDDTTFGDGVTDEIVRAAERELDVDFPRELREYLQRLGHIDIDHLEFFGLGRDVPEYLDIVQLTKSEQTESGCPLPKGLIPLLNDGGGNLYCIVAHGQHAGSIVFWDHEAGPNQEPPLQAPSMREWILSLLEELDDEPDDPGRE